MRGLVVGLGSIGRRHASNWAALGLGPLAVCRQRNDPLPRPFRVETSQYTDLDVALAREQPDIVIVANPTSLHVDTACRALQAGAHVFVEKPLSHTLRGVQQLLDEATSRRKQVMVGYNLRFHPLLIRVKALVDEGVIGKITSARAEVGEYLPDWHPWEDYRHSYSGRGDLGGGAVLTFSHELDALCWLLGAPRRVTAIAAHASSLEIDTEDTAEIVLQFESGPIGSVHVDYVRRAQHRSIELVGEGGVLRADYGRNCVEQYVAATGQWRVEEGDPRLDRNQMYLDELRHFASCVSGEMARPLVDAQQGAAIVALSVAALEAARDGRSRDFDTADEPASQWLSALNRPNR
jgi:predicted dehydrogenase